MNSEIQQNNEPIKKIGKIKRSLHIAKQSWKLFKKTKYLALFPLASGLVGLSFLLLIVGGIFFGLFGGNVEAMKSISFDFENETTASLVQACFAIGFILFVLITTFISLFFRGGMVSAINKELQGEKSSFSGGMRDVKPYASQLFIWALISTTVGVVIQIIKEKGQFLGRIIGGLSDVAWNLVTMFSVPLIVLDDIKATQTIKKSTQVFSKTWGENIILNLPLSLAFFFIYIIEMLVVFIGAYAISPNFNDPVIWMWAFPVLLVLVFITGFVHAILSAIFKITLYRYAQTGELPDGFDEQIVRSTVKHKKKKGWRKK